MLLECTFGELRFSGKILTDYTRTFEVILASASIQECVQECYELSCIRAAFTRFPRSACLLNFARNELELTQSCALTPTTQLDTKWNFNSIAEVVELECLRCVKRDLSEIINNTGKFLMHILLYKIYFISFIIYFNLKENSKTLNK